MGLGPVIRDQWEKWFTPAPSNTHFTKVEPWGCREEKQCHHLSEHIGQEWCLCVEADDQVHAHGGYVKKMVLVWPDPQIFLEKPEI